MGVTLLVGTEKGLFGLDSDKSRSSWNVREPAHKGWQVYSLHDAGDALYAGLSSRIYGPHLVRSTDRGRTWTPIETGPRLPEGSSRKLLQIWSIDSGPGDGELWAGVAEAALFTSHDSGRSWTLNQGLEGHPTRESWQPGAGGLCLHTIVRDPTRPRRAFIGISAVGIFRTDDGGDTWAAKNSGVEPTLPEEAPKYTEIDRCVHKFVMDPSDPDLLYQQNHIGVFRSRDAGDSWKRIEDGLPSDFGFPMVLLPDRPRTLFVVPQESSEYRMFPGGRLRVYRSDDGGDHWAACEAGLPQPSYGGVLRNSMTVDRMPATGVYFGTTSGEVYASLDGGESWRRLPGTYPRVQSLAAIAG